MKRNPKPKPRNPNQPKGKTPAQQPQTRTALFLTPLRPNQPPLSFFRSAQQPTLQPNRARVPQHAARPAPLQPNPVRPRSAQTGPAPFPLSAAQPSSFLLSPLPLLPGLFSPARKPSPRPIPASGPNLSLSRSSVPLGPHRARAL